MAKTGQSVDQDAHDGLQKLEQKQLKADPEFLDYRARLEDRWTPTLPCSTKQDRVLEGYISAATLAPTEQGIVLGAAEVG
jgi:hypothetical protein